MGSLQAWRARWERPGDQLLERIQWLFVLLNCLLAVTSPLDLSVPSAPPWPLSGLLLAVAVVFGGWSVLYFRRASGRYVLDVIPLVLLFTGGVVGGPDWMFARMYIAVFLAALYRPGRARMVFLATSYLTVYQVAGVLSGEPFVVVSAISEGVSLLVVVGIMQTLAAAVKRHERFARRDAMLTAVVGGLMGERDPDRIHKIVADAAFEMVGVPGALVTVWKADGNILRRVGVAGMESHPFVEADLDKVSQEFRDIFFRGQPAYLDADQMNAINRSYGIDNDFVATVLAPMLSGGQPTGLLAVGSPEPLDEDLLRVFERFAHEVALAQQLAESEAKLTGLVQNSSDIIAVVDSGGIFTFVSAAATATAGVAPELLLGKSLSALLRHETTSEPLTSPEHISPGTLTPLRLDSGVRECDVEVTVNPLPDGTTILNIRDVSERRRLEAEIEHRAFYDSVTGLPNRDLLLDRLGQALGRTQRGSGMVAVVVVDLDDFKTVNDSLGHAAGDTLLAGIAARLEGVIRDSDTAARIGGDEFALVIESLSSQAEALVVTDRILDALRQPLQLHSCEVPTSASVGLAVWAGETPEELIRNADTAMYVAKRAGKNRTAVFEPSMLAYGLNRLELRSELDAAVRNGEFVLHYQPIMILDTGEVAGFEALVRWNHPTRGLIAPMDFIPLAEETGLIVPLGRWILDEACAQISAWQEVSDAVIGLSVNLSAVQLRSSDIVNDVALALSVTGLDPSRLTLEVTETALVGDPEAVAGVLRSLKTLGVRLAIDDFGTGYSSFTHLQLLPVDVIKVDRSFVSVVADGPEQAALAEAIVSIAHALGLETVAEGVESAAHADILQTWGCSYAQGWLWHPALSAADASALLTPVKAHSQS